MRCLQRRPIRAQKEGGNREKAWSMLQENTKKGKKTKALAARAFGKKSGTPGWIRTSGLPLRSTAYHFVNCSYHIFPCCFFANCAAWRQVNLHKFP